MKGALALAVVLAACAPGAGPSPSPSASAVAAATATATATSAPTPSPTPTPSPAPSPSPTPTPTPVPTAAPPAGIPAVRLERAFAPLAFTNMTGAFQAPDGRWFVLEQAGRILTFREGDAAAKTFLDLRGQIQAGGEEGLLGFAFAPDFAKSGVFFLDYNRLEPRRTVISSMVARGDAADPATEAVLLEIAQPFPNHKGGQLAFGPDGYLYIAMGDGGSGGDPFKNGQNTDALLGKILRIDVKDRARYAVPPDNPFAAGGGRGEIFAFGLRNPWRFSFDGNDLWVADVGQNRWEEIDLVRKGGNYGWNVMEGAHCYNAATCNTEGLILPVTEYDHGAGACSVTGGFVYRGAAVPELVGAYVFGDYCNGRVSALRYANGKVTAQAEIVAAGFQISSFARDLRGEVYVLQYGGAGGVFKIVR